MKLENEFIVPEGIDTLFDVLGDPERVTPCFPGATLDSRDGDDFTGSLKVKLGPISMTYKGKGTIVERDYSNRRIVIDAQARDSRGNGTATVRATLTMTTLASGKTKVDVLSDMQVTGKPAQFGRGVMSDVGDKILGQFASCLADELRATPPQPQPQPQPRGSWFRAAREGSTRGGTSSATPDSRPTAAAAPIRPLETHRAGSPRALPTIFLSYRRGDTAYQAEMLYDVATTALGRDRVFKDVDSIAPGDDFVDAIDRAVIQCDIVLVLIGDRWLTGTDEQGLRRLDSPTDFVRLEIESALARRKRVVPVLLGTAMPAIHDLPSAIAPLARRQAVQLSATRFASEAQRLIESLLRAISRSAQ